jgi:hypothetical protein
MDSAGNSVSFSIAARVERREIAFRTEGIFDHLHVGWQRICCDFALAH